MSKGLAQCKVGATPYTVPVTHLVALRPEKTAPSLSPLAFAQAKRWLRSHTLLTPGEIAALESSGIEI